MGEEEKKVAVVTFATPSHASLQEEFSKLYGNKFNEVYNYTSKMVEDSEFYKKNMDVFKYKKYFGYFLWKPFIIRNTFEYTKCDYVLYCDSNIRFTNIDNFLFRFCEVIEEDKIFFVKHAYWLNKDWTKRDTFVLMQVDEERFWNSKQIWSVLFGFSNDPLSKQILDEYLTMCRDPRIITEIPNECGLPNFDGFREHRWEQSVLSILCEKYKIPGITEYEAMSYYQKIYTPEITTALNKQRSEPLATI